MDTGRVGGAIVVIGMCGGLAISGRGRAWARALTGLLAVGITGVMVFMFYFQDQGVSALWTFDGVYLGVLMVWLAGGCSVPTRRSTTVDNTAKVVPAGVG